MYTNTKLYYRNIDIHLWINVYNNAFISVHCVDY